MMQYATNITMTEAEQSSLQAMTKIRAGGAGGCNSGTRMMQEGFG